MRRVLLVFTAIVANFTICHSQEQRPYQEPFFGDEWSKPSEHPDRIVVNFGEDPATTASVTWRTAPIIYEAIAEIAIASGAPAKTSTFDASAIDTAKVVANYHSATFNDLQPNTTYAYRVGDGNRWSEWIQFKTASDNPEGSFSFLYVVDTQNFILELWSRLIREGYKTAPDASFIIHAGDLVNNAHREQEWEEWFIAGGWIHSSLPSFPVPGNHEYRPLNEEKRANKVRSLSAQWKPQFTLPEYGPEGLKESV